MKILVVADDISSNTGGGKVGILGLCNSLQNEKNEVTLVTSGIDNELYNFKTFQINLKIENINTIFFVPNFSLMGMRFSYLFYKYLSKEIAKFDLIVIHSIYKFHSTIASIYSKKFNVPYVIRPHGSLDPFLIYNGKTILKKIFISIFEKRNFKNASAIQFSCELERENAQKFISCWKNTLIIPEGIKNNFYNKRKVFLKKNTLNILFLGRIHKKKGIELLIEALGKIKSKVNFHFTLVGSGDKSYEDYIFQMIDENNLSNFCTITGYISTSMKQKIYEKTDLFILPSYGENFGIAVVEAMSFGIPVLVTNKVGIYNSIVKYKAGIVTNNNVNEIIESIILLNNKKRLQFLSSNALKLVNKKYTLAKMGKLLNKKYLEIVK